MILEKIYQMIRSQRNKVYAQAYLTEIRFRKESHLWKDMRISDRMRMHSGRYAGLLACE